MGSQHLTVLLNEAVDALQVKPDHWYVDATFGRGGHTAAILEKKGKVLAFDCDVEAITFGEEKFAKEIQEGRLILVRENFEKLEQVAAKLKSEDKVGQVYGVLFDFGVSSPQLDSDTRGFSFQYNAELDMRMDDRLGVKAKDLLALLSEKQLTEIFREFGGESEAKKVAQSIVQARELKAIHTVQDLVDVVKKAKHEKRGHLHPATKVFQALRIVVNSEMDSITVAIPQALELLEPGGRIVTISFHEGEDRSAKYRFRDWENHGRGQHLTKHVLTPSTNEVEGNVRSRSAKMRIFEKAS